MKSRVWFQWAMQSVCLNLIRCIVTYPVNSAIHNATFKQPGQIYESHYFIDRATWNYVHKIHSKVAINWRQYINNDVEGIFEADLQGSYSNYRGISQSSRKNVGLLGKVKDLGVLNPYDVVTGLWSYNSELLTTTHSIYMSSKTLQ